MSSATGWLWFAYLDVGAPGRPLAVAEAHTPEGAPAGVLAA